MRETTIQNEDRAASTARTISHAMVTAFAVWSVSAFVPKRGGFPLDESWTHQVFARTFVEKGALALAPGQHDATFLSPLWDLLLAVNLVAVKTDPAWWAFGVNVLLHVAAANLLLSVVARDVPAEVPPVSWRVACLAAVSAVASSADLVGFVSSGTETTLFIALVVLAIWCASSQRFVLAGVVAALSAITRPEGLFVGALVVVSCLAEKRSLRRAVLVALPNAFVGGALVLMTSLGKLHFSSTMFSGRHWLWFETSAGLANSDLRWEIFSAWVSRLGDSAGLSKHHPAFVWLALGLAAYGAFRLALVRSAGARLLMSWGLVQGWWLFRNFMPQGPNGAWQPFVPVFFALCAALGVSFFVWDVVRSRTGTLDARIGAAGGLLAMGWVALGQEGLVAQRSAYHLAVADIDATVLEMGKRVSQLPDSAVVASFDTGAIAHRAERPLIDIGRLADPDLAILTERGRVWEYLREKGVTHVVLAETLASRLHLDDNPAVSVKAVSTVSALSRSFTLYEVSYTGQQGPRRVLPARWAVRGIWDDERLVPRRDRMLAEHLFGILAEWDVRVDLAVLKEPRPIGGGIRENTKDPAPPCAIEVGMWGVDVDECELVGPTAEVRTTLVRELRPYIEAKDVGGAVRAIPHILTRIRRSTDERFVPLLPPLRPPSADGKGAAPWTAPTWGIVLSLATFLLAMAAALGATPRTRRDAWRKVVVSRLRSLVR